jgi:hypothetical protein
MVKLEPVTRVPLGVVTVTLPVVVPAATTAVIWVEELTTKLAALVALNFTTVAPVKADPVRITVVPTGPLVGENAVT